MFPALRSTWNHHRRLLVVVLVVQFLLPQFYGSLLDSHFAERRPDHAHLYAGLVAPPHVHSYEVAQDDAPAESREANGAQESMVPVHHAYGLVYVTSPDFVAQGLAQPDTPAFHLSLALALEHGFVTLSVPSTGDHTWSDADLPPPKQPPRL